MLINGYDFDNTIYRGDSSFDFFRHCAAKYPRALLSALGAMPWMFAMALGFADKTRVKQRFYRYLRHVPDVAEEVERFWLTHDKNLKDWYFAQKREDDLGHLRLAGVPARAAHAAAELKLIASRVDARTGRYDGLNCHGEEKVRRMRELCPETQIDRFIRTAGMIRRWPGSRGRRLW